MKSQMLITPTSNINKNRMIDESNVLNIIKDTNEDIDIYDIEDNTEKTIKLIDISVYDNQIIINKKRHAILRMLSA